MPDLDIAPNDAPTAYWL